MHALSHSLAHRATPATRSRARWQPYSSTSNSMTTSLSSPSSTVFSTPSSSATSSPPPSSFRPSSKPFSHPIKEISSRELSKNKFALGLVDQAVSSLSEIWKPQDIPAVFLTGPKATLDCPVGQKSQSRQPNPCLLSSPLATEIHSSAFKNKLVPIKGFVHEVLRRSRTSGHVLQTALCYIEALRPKVPEFIRKERTGESWKEPASVDFVEVLADAELQQHAEVQLPLDSTLCADRSDFIVCPPSTCKITDESCEQDCVPGMPAAVASKLACSDTLPLAVELPSPLLCPRRSFLAALILASKFTQDKCYSNRAWAKLSGLTPREISRCERALGEALEWRLWVGKLPLAALVAPRALHRSQSESCLNSQLSDSFLQQSEHEQSSATIDRPLRRCSTLPAEAFAPVQKTDGYAISDIVMSDSQAVTQYTIPTILSQRPATCHNATEDSPDSQSSTPSLVYSPTSSDSSSGGERTIQASSFQGTPENVLSQIHNALGDHLLLSLPTPGIVTKEASGLQGFPVMVPSVFLPAAIIEEGIRSTWRLEDPTFV